MADEGLEAPGWHAIDEALRPIHGDCKPLHWAPALPAIAGGEDPLEGISAYRVDAPAHWHFVTYGLSELYAKESDDTAVSGWGLELTFRLARRDGDAPPGWARSFLNNLARYVFQTGNVFAPGHHLNLNGAIALGADTAIRAVAFTLDPQLPAIETPNGRVAFIQVVGLCLDELDVIRGWNTERFLDLLRAEDPLLLTDLGRRSYLDRPALRDAAAEGARRDGSSQEVCFVSVAEWELGVEARATLGATAALELLRLVPRRLPYGKPFTLAGRTQSLRVEPGPFPAWRAEGDVLAVSLPADGCAAFLAGMTAVRGTYRWPALPGLVVTVVPSEIRDRDGEVVKVVG